MCSSDLPEYTLMWRGLDSEGVTASLCRAHTPLQRAFSYREVVRMKRIAFVMAVVALAGCSKGEQKPAASTADTSHQMMMMGDTSKHMMMDTSKKMTPPAAPATKKKS